MAETVKQAQYFYVEVLDKTGEEGVCKGSFWGAWWLCF